MKVIKTDSKWYGKKDGWSLIIELEISPISPIVLAPTVASTACTLLYFNFVSTAIDNGININK